MPYRLLLALGLVAFSLPVHAAEEEEDDPFFGTISFGYLATTGNTETTSLDTQVSATYRTGRWEHAASGQAFTSSESNVPNAEYYTARGWEDGVVPESKGPYRA